MMTLLVALLALNAEAAIPKRVELTGSKWCATHKADDRTDRLTFMSSGAVKVESFGQSSGSIQQTQRGKWELKDNTLRLKLRNRATAARVEMSDDGREMRLSSGAKAVICN